MQDIDIKLLAEICETPGAPGFEQHIRAVIVREVTPLADEVRIDNMGNVIALKRGKSRKKVMAAAHMDEIGFMVTHIDSNGFLRFTTLGGFDPKTLTAQRVVVHGKKDLIGVMGSKPIHLMEPEERNKAPKITDFFIDLGLPVEEVQALVSIGAPITRERSLIIMGKCVNCKSIDNRVSVYMLVETLKALQNKTIPYDFYAVFTVQEEVGIRGAQVATLQLQPDFGIAIDTTIAFDVPGSQEHEQITHLGKGAAIKIMDASVICDYRMVTFMKNMAAENQIPWQPEILTGGGTDTANIQRMTAGGAISGAISIPTRHIHQVIEMAHTADIIAGIRLLTSCVQKIDTHTWQQTIVES